MGKLTGLTDFVKEMALAEKIMAECEKDGEPITKDEALEMARMELKSNENRHYEKSDKPRKKSTCVRKVDEDKKQLLSCIKVLLEGMKAVIIAIKTETEIEFAYKGNLYTLKLIKHRIKED